MAQLERAILDVLFPKVRAQLLRLLFDLPQKQRYVRELANMSGLALCTTQDELRKLTAVGLLTSWSNGYHRFYRANKKHPVFPQLVRLVQLSARLPQTKHSALNRQRRSRSQSRRGRRSMDSASSREASWVGLVPAE